MIKRLLGTCGALVVAAAMAQAAPTASAAPAYREYVALGDSWAADASIVQASATHVPIDCAQSARNFAKQVAAAIAVPVFRDATCGSSETVHMTEPQRLPLGGVAPPQFDRLTPATDLVTVEIGGNDAGLAAAVTDCVTTDPAVSPCQAGWVPGGVDKMSAAIEATEPKVLAVLRGIRERAPQARVLLVDYFQGVGVTHGCFPTIPISDVDSVWIGRKLMELNAMLRRAASAAGVEFVDTYSTSGGHDACQAPGVRWIEGLMPVSSTPAGLAVPFHPNQLGADHQARSVLAAIGR